MSTSKLRLEVEAKSEALREWVSALREARSAVAELHEEGARYSGAVGGESAAGPRGGLRDQPAPTGRATRQQRVEHDDPTPRGARAHRPDGWIDGSGRKPLEAVSSDAGRGRPADPATPSGAAPAQKQDAGSHLGGMGSLVGGAVGGAGGAMVGSMIGEKLGGMMGEQGTLRNLFFSAVSGGALTGRSPLQAAGDVLGNYGGKAVGAATAFMGYGLGSNPLSFILGSGDKFLALSRSLTQIEQRFRSAAGNAATFGQALGYTIERSAALASTLGEATNTVDRSQFRRYAGVARVTGADPNMVMRSLGMMERWTGGQLGDDQLLGLAGQAARSGMAEGRFGEYLQSLVTLTERAAQQTGQVGGAFAAGQGAMALGGQVFGVDSPFAQGQAGLGFAERVGGVLNQQGTMRSYMLRSMGLGQGDGPSYREASMQLEAGAFDASNLTTLFEGLQRRGLDEDSQFVALQQLAGGQLKSWEVDALVRTFNAPGGLDAYQKAMAGTTSDQEAFLATLDPSMRAVLEQQGFGAAGGMAVSAGEGREVRLEALAMRFGDRMSQIMESGVGTFEALMDAIETMFPSLGADLVRLAQGVEDLTRWLGSYAPANVPGQVGPPARAAGSVMQLFPTTRLPGYLLDRAGSWLEDR